MARLTSALLVCLAGLAAALPSSPPYNRQVQHHPVYVFTQWGKAHIGLGRPRPSKKQEAFEEEEAFYRPFAEKPANEFPPSEPDVAASISGPDPDSPSGPKPDSTRALVPDSPDGPDPDSPSLGVGATDYLFFSWRAIDLNPRDRYTWQEAYDQCESRGLKLVSLDTPEKNNRVADQIFDDGVAYSWTSGERVESGKSDDFVWGNGNPVSGFTSWSPTGGDGNPQPDSREGPENCLAIINNAYGEGVFWHDIECSREKHFVCEQGKGSE